MKILSNILFFLNILLFFVAGLFAMLSSMISDVPGDHSWDVLFLLMSFLLPILILISLFYSRKFYKEQYYNKSNLIYVILFVYYIFHFFVLSLFWPVTPPTGSVVLNLHEIRG